MVARVRVRYPGEAFDHSPMSLLEVSHLRKSFGTNVAVDDLSFRVEAGEIFGLLGPNGAGKSTTMMMVAGLRQPDSGTVTIAGKTAAAGKREVQMMLGVVPQDLAIYPDLTAYENLDFFGRIYGVRGAELEARIQRVLNQIGLDQHAGQYVRTFSGGMKRRLNFGAAVLHEPKFVILDEPTVGVDPQSRSHLLDCVRELADRGVGIIYASHYMEEVEAICQRVAIVDHGRLLVCGTLDELLEKSRADLHLRVAAPAADIRHRLLGLADVADLGENESDVVIRRERNALPGSLNGRVAAVLEILAAAQIDTLAIETREHNLERLFLQLTGRKLRD